MKKKTPRRLRILALMHESLIPPDDTKGVDLEAAEWKTEYCVVSTLRRLGHEVFPLGVGSNLGVIRNAIHELEPQIAFNLLEGFDDVATWDQNVVAYLELSKMPYTGCNSRGLLLAREKSIAKKLLTYHRIPVADFAVFPRGRKVKRPKRLAFPLFVKSLTLDASIGISQASVVEDEEELETRVEFIHESIGTDALVEHFIDGRELYVGILGNQQLQVLPIWELSFTKMPEEKRRIATERLKWSLTYQKKQGQGPAGGGRGPHPRHLQADLPQPDAERLRAHRPAADRGRPGLRHRGQPQSPALRGRGLRPIGQEGRGRLREPAPAHRQPRPALGAHPAGLSADHGQTGPYMARAMSAVRALLFFSSSRPRTRTTSTKGRGP